MNDVVEEPNPKEKATPEEGEPRQGEGGQSDERQRGLLRNLAAISVRIKEHPAWLVFVVLVPTLLFAGGWLALTPWAASIGLEPSDGHPKIVDLKSQAQTLDVKLANCEGAKDTAEREKQTKEKDLATCAGDLKASKSELISSSRQLEELKQRLREEVPVLDLSTTLEAGQRSGIFLANIGPSTGYYADFGWYVDGVRVAGKANNATAAMASRLGIEDDDPTRWHYLDDERGLEAGGDTYIVLVEAEHMSRPKAKELRRMLNRLGVYIKFCDSPTPDARCWVECAGNVNQRLHCGQEEAAAPPWLERLSQLLAFTGETAYDAPTL